MRKFLTICLPLALLSTLALAFAAFAQPAHDGTSAEAILVAQTNHSALFVANTALPVPAVAAYLHQPAMITCHPQGDGMIFATTVNALNVVIAANLTIAATAQEVTYEPKFPNSVLMANSLASTSGHIVTNPAKRESVGLINSSVITARMKKAGTSAEEPASS